MTKWVGEQPPVSENGDAMIGDSKRKQLEKEQNENRADIFHTRVWRTSPGSTSVHNARSTSFSIETWTLSLALALRSGALGEVPGEWFSRGPASGG